MKKRFTVSVITASLLAAGCATTSRMMGDSSGNPCNPLIGAGIGAALGAAIGSHNRAVGAAIGVGVGALTCVAVNAISHQTRSAEQVETEYREAHAGQLPPGEPVVRAYNVTLNPSGNVRSGEKVQLVSNVTVVRGANQPVNEVKEVLTLIGPEGNRTAEKKANERPGSGSYENTFNLTFPEGVSPGTYPVKTQLYVNGKAVAEQQQNLRVVANGGQLRFVLVAVE